MTNGGFHLSGQSGQRKQIVAVAPIYTIGKIVMQFEFFLAK